MKWLDRKLQQARLRQVAPYIGPGARVLDVGCADGALLVYAPQIGGYVGVDPDVQTDTSAPGRVFRRGRFPSAVDGIDGLFDVMVATAVLEHVPADEQPAFAAACAVRLVAGGRLALTVPSPMVDHVLRVMKTIGLLDGMRDGEHYGFDPLSTPVVFGSSGFQLEVHRRFELGLNHLFVFRRASTSVSEKDADPLAR